MLHNKCNISRQTIGTYITINFKLCDTVYRTMLNGLIKLALIGESRLAGNKYEILNNLLHKYLSLTPGKIYHNNSQGF